MDLEELGRCRQVCPLWRSFLDESASDVTAFRLHVEEMEFSRALMRVDPFGDDEDEEEDEEEEEEEEEESEGEGAHTWTIMRREVGCCSIRKRDATCRFLFSLLQ